MPLSPKNFAPTAEQFFSVARPEEAKSISRPDVKQFMPETSKPIVPEIRNDENSSDDESLASTQNARPLAVDVLFDNYSKNVQHQPSSVVFQYKAGIEIPGSLRQNFDDSCSEYFSDIETDFIGSAKV